MAHQGPLTERYSEVFYQSIQAGSRQSAAACVPILIDLLAPSSVVDVGCGSGEWIAEFLHQGVTDVLGIDGPHVPVEALAVPQDRFLRRDLALPIGEVPRRFSLAMSLEVAEHLPPDRAESFVDDLCRLADTVVFGAAVPGQAGRHHVNEQWQSYWARLFWQRGYSVGNELRIRVWSLAAIQGYYRQNMLVYRRVDTFPLDGRARWVDHPFLLDVVHPEVFLTRLETTRYDVVDYLKSVPGRLWRRVRGGRSD